MVGNRVTSAWHGIEIGGLTHSMIGGCKSLSLLVVVVVLSIVQITKLADRRSRKSVENVPRGD